MAAARLKQSPLARVKDEFGGKDKLVDKIVGVLDSGDESKDELRKRLLSVSNGEADPAVFGRDEDKAAGGHDKLVASTADKLKRGKDKDYVEKLGELSNGRLLDMLAVGRGRARGGGGGPAASAAKAAARPRRRPGPRRWRRPSRPRKSRRARRRRSRRPRSNRRARRPEAVTPDGP